LVSTASPSTRSGLFGLAGALLGIGVVLALTPAVLDLDSTDCGALNCALVQTLGKVVACLGVATATALVIVRSLARRNFSAAALAFFLFFPTVVWAGLALQTYWQGESGSGEVHRLNGAARDYAAPRLGRPASELRALTIDGKQGWVAVRVSAPDGGSRLVLLQSVGGEWTPRAIGPTFSKGELRALGAPTDLLRDAD
jgi:hypothetical protein